MRLATIPTRYLARNKFRLTLTVGMTAASLVAFLLVRTLLTEWEGAARNVTTERLVTRRKASLFMELPRSFVDDVRRVPHVTAVTFTNFFAGKDPIRPGDFFSSVAVDPGTYFLVYDELTVPPDQLDAWSRDKHGAVVGRELARKHGWKLGDEITLESGLYAGLWPLRVDAICTTKTKSGNEGQLLLHWDYLNDSRPSERRDTVLWIATRIDDPVRVADVGAAIDRLAELGGTPTVSQDMRSFTRAFVAVYSAIFTALDVVSGVVLCVMLLGIGNTMAMGARERTRDYGVLRVLGFRPAQVALMVFTESVAIGALGAALGLAIAFPLVDLGVGRFLEERVGGLFPHFRLGVHDVVVGLVLTLGVAAAAGAVPARAASKVSAINAIRRA
jgi:putative ABC transport system permease protein